MANIYRFKFDLGGTSPVAEYAVYTQSGVSQGDMMQWDSGARKATSNLLASGSVFLGVAEGANPLAGLGTTTAPLTGSVVRIKQGGVHAFKTTTSETYVHRTVVYQGADAQTVSTVGSTRAIGIVWLPDGTSVTGASGTDVNVLILPNGLQTQGATA